METLAAGYGLYGAVTGGVGAGMMGLAALKTGSAMATQTYNAKELFTDIGNAKRYIKHLKGHIKELLSLPDASFCHLRPLVMYVNYMQVWMHQTFFQTYGGSVRKTGTAAVRDVSVLMDPRWYREELGLMMRTLVQEHQLLQDEVSRRMLGIRPMSTAACRRETEVLKRRAWDECKGCMNRTAEFQTWLDNYHTMVQEGLHRMGAEEGAALPLTRNIGRLGLQVFDVKDTRFADEDEAMNYLTDIDMDAIKFLKMTEGPGGDGPMRGQKSKPRAKKSSSSQRTKAAKRK